MKKFLTVTTAVASLMLGANGAFALDESKSMEGMYVAGEGESRMVMGGQMTEGARVMMGENGAAPSECPAGSFYEVDGRITACEGGDAFNLSEPGAGMMMSDGKAYPDGAMMMMRGTGGVEDTTGSDANSGSDGSAATSGN